MKKLPKRSFLKSSKKGFTLVEMLVAIGILLILLSSALLIIDPIAQFQKVRNSQRKHDLNQIKNALDTYYNDHSCYPASIPFGEEWLDGNVVLMKKIPTDPQLVCVSGNCYPYQYYTEEGSNCPQWNIVFSTLEGKIKNTPDTCRSMLKEKLCPSADFRFNFSTRYYYCIFSGSINKNICQIIVDQGGVGTVPIGEITTTTTTVPGSTTTTVTGPYVCNCDPNQYPGKKLYDIRGTCNDVNTAPYKYCDDKCTQPCDPNY